MRIKPSNEGLQQVPPARITYDAVQFSLPERKVTFWCEGKVVGWMDVPKRMTNKDMLTVTGLQGSFGLEVVKI